MAKSYRPPVLDENGREVPCLVEECTGVRERKNGYCDAHYWRNHKYGSPTANSGGRLIRSNLDRFWDKVNKNGPIPDYAPHLGPCWVWTGASSVGGYGALRINLAAANDQSYRLNTRVKNSGILGKTVKAYRFSWEIANGPIPAGLHIDHLCRVPACVNPNHLEPVTQAENNRRNPNWVGNDRSRARYTHWPKGTNRGIKRPMSWFHNKYHVRGQSVNTMPDCPECRT